MGSSTETTLTASDSTARRAARRVPEITLYFWIIKRLTTAMGEVTSDFLAHQLNPVIAVALGGVGLALIAHSLEAPIMCARL